MVPGSPAGYKHAQGLKHRGSKHHCTKRQPWHTNTCMQSSGCTIKHGRSALPILRSLCTLRIGTQLQALTACVGAWSTHKTKRCIVLPMTFSSSPESAGRHVATAVAVSYLVHSQTGRPQPAQREMSPPEMATVHYCPPLVLHRPHTLGQLPEGCDKSSTAPSCSLLVLQTPVLPVPSHPCSLCGSTQNT